MSKSEDILKEKKLSITEARKSVLDVFLQKKKPLNVNDFRKIKKFKDINESSIYRNLSKLEEVGIIQAIPGSGKFQSYELSPDGHHHHHISCSKCKTIECLHLCSLDKQMQEIASKVGFLLTGHSVELIGLCKNCV